MKKLFQLSLLALCITNTYAQNAAQSNYVNKMVDAINQAQNNQKPVWPSFKELSQPIIIHFNKNKNFDMYAFNFHPQNKDWEHLIINGRSVYHMDYDKYDLKNKYWGYEQIEGQKVFVSFDFGYPNIETNVAKTISNLFFHLQHDKKSSPFSETDDFFYKMPAYDGINDLYQIKLSYLEIAALKSYLTSKNYIEKQEHLADAVAINVYRMQILDNESKSYETKESKEFGLSSYVGWKSLSLDNEGQYAKALNPTCNFEHITESSVYDCLLRFRGDFLNVGYGIALDNKTNSAWKKELEQNPNATIESSIRYIYSFDANEAKMRVDNIIKNNKYNFRDINQKIDKNLSSRLNKIQKLKAEYENLSDIEVRVSALSIKDSIKANKFSMLMASENETYEITNHLRLNINFTNNISWVGSGFTIQFMQMPYVFENLDDRSPESAYTMFKVGPETKLVIDGKEMTVGAFMANIKHQVSNHISMSGEHFTLIDHNDFITPRYDLDGRSGALLLQAHY